LRSARRQGAWAEWSGPLTREPLAYDADATLRRMIVRRELAPGARITEAEMAGLLGVSRTPVREAFPQLACDEWLTLLPGRRPQVKPTTLNSIDEVYPLLQHARAENTRLHRVVTAASCEPAARGFGA
jgi:DNA-binding GntR family transcriptional regulator